MPTSQRPNDVAERKLFVRRDDGGYEPLRVTFDRPIRQPTGEWGCTYRIDGQIDIGGATNSAPVYGVDGVQALQLAMRYVDQVLLHSKAFAEGRLCWTDKGGQLRLHDLPVRLGGVREGAGLRMDEVVRTIEVQVEWSLPCALRIEVMKSQYGPQTSYWTRVWRSDTYRLAPTANALRQEPFAADETFLVEDLQFSDDPSFSKTPDAAIEETIARIKWQLFSKGPSAEPQPRRPKAKAKARPKGRR